ncbi:MAG: HU family DNA-binding protein [Ruminococcaceae bacterium]|nr:HU family DNA-binding protein [Oscillospiraceae bacterium]
MMNKSQLIDVVSKDTGLKRKEAEAAVNSVFSAIESALVDGEKVQLIGFGSFSVKERGERTGRNPATGAAITIPASKQPAFVAGRDLKAKINK